ncbi:MAG: gliding motility-associated C-terminal domain-containing protein [Bacteroidales bacterium]|nr:gliding motility-associated C-terminal domain-containing protein [Bacteroidales bacterium]
MKRISLFLCLVVLVASTQIKAQSSCPGLKNPVSFGMYSNYSGQMGSREDGTSTYQTQYLQMTSAVIPFTQMATTVGGTTSPYCITGNDGNNIFVIKNTGTDPHTLNRLSYTPPSDDSFIKSIRLGNCYGGAEAEGLYYTMRVSPENALIFIHYAIVLYNALHGTDDNPEFIIRVKRETQEGSGVYTNISDTLCYIVQSPTSSNNLGVWQNTGGSGGAYSVYKPWTKVAINLYQYLNQNVRIEVYTGDCSFSAHYGYCYIAGDCQPMKLQASDCAAGDATHVATIAAPKGLDTYRWQRKNGVGNWEDITGATDSILLVQTTDFYVDNTGNRVATNEFKCIMTSALDPSKPITSYLQTTVNNKKPYISIDTTMDCDGSIVLTDRSVAPYTPSDDDVVDTNLSVWDFGDGSAPVTGGKVRHVYANPGEYVVTLRSSAANGTCYAINSRPVKIRRAPKVQIFAEDTTVCYRDRPYLIAQSSENIREYLWVVEDVATGARDSTQRNMDSTLVGYPFRDTSIVYLTATNFAGCDTTVSITIYAEEYPRLIVTGDTVICNGNESVVNVSSHIKNCTFEWYTDTTRASINVGPELVRQPTKDETYYVKVTTPNGCVGWDSLCIRLMVPELTSDKTKVCSKDTVVLIAKNAVYYKWTSTPPDPSLEGQESNDTIKVAPAQTTIYEMVGLGSDSCRATPLTKEITVYQYPVPELEYSPRFVDSEDPFITFTNLTPGITETEWNFFDGEIFTTPSVTYEFKDFTIDSVSVKLTTSNELGCTSDTTVKLPVSVFAVWVPNAFTPDKPENNVFRSYTGNNIRDYSLYIYDREGRQVFYTDDKDAEWDGTFKGRKCEKGVYVWVVSYRRLETDKVIQQKGTVTLLR